MSADLDAIALAAATEFFPLPDKLCAPYVSEKAIYDNQVRFVSALKAFAAEAIAQDRKTREGAPFAIRRFVHSEMGKIGIWPSGQKYVEIRSDGLVYVVFKDGYELVSETITAKTAMRALDAGDWIEVPLVDRMRPIQQQLAQQSAALVVLEDALRGACHFMASMEYVLMHHENPESHRFLECYPPVDIRDAALKHGLAALAQLAEAPRAPSRTEREDTAPEVGGKEWCHEA